MKFEIFNGKDGKIYFNLKARNGQVVLRSQGYANKAGAKNGIDSVRSNCKDDSCYEIKVAKNGKPHFNLLAKNNQVVGSSQMYASRATMRKGMASVRNVAPKATVVDLTD